MAQGWRRRLERLMADGGFNMKSLSLASGLGETYVRDLLKRGREPTVEKIHRIARCLHVAVADIMGADWTGQPRGRAEPVLVGKVGAGAQIVRFEEGVVLEAVAPPDYGGIAARVEGDSMPPFRDGWLIFYRAEHRGVAEDCINKLCVVGLKDGAVLIKILHRGSRKGLFDLESWNGPMRRDVELSWASRVTDIKPA